MDLNIIEDNIQYSFEELENLIVSLESIGSEIESIEESQPDKISDKITELSIELQTMIEKFILKQENQNYMVKPLNFKLDIATLIDKLIAKDKVTLTAKQAKDVLTYIPAIQQLSKISTLNELTGEKMFNRLTFSEVKENEDSGQNFKVEELFTNYPEVIIAKLNDYSNIVDVANIKTTCECNFTSDTIDVDLTFINSDYKLFISVLDSIQNSYSDIILAHHNYLRLLIKYSLNIARPIKDNVDSYKVLVKFIKGVINIKVREAKNIKAILTTLYILDRVLKD